MQGIRRELIRMPKRKDRAKTYDLLERYRRAYNAYNYWVKYGLLEDHRAFLSQVALALGEQKDALSKDSFLHEETKIEWQIKESLPYYEEILDHFERHYPRLVRPLDLTSPFEK